MMPYFRDDLHQLVIWHYEMFQDWTPIPSNNAYHSCVHSAVHGYLIHDYSLDASYRKYNYMQLCNQG